MNGPHNGDSPKLLGQGDPTDVALGQSQGVASWKELSSAESSGFSVFGNDCIDSDCRPRPSVLRRCRGGRDTGRAVSSALITLASRKSLSTAKHTRS